MDEVKVSVVMPVLNGMPYFRKALESVLCQTLKELEVLVVDSGSTDGTIEYVREIVQRDSRVRLINAKKKSLGYQYNLGIKNAKGRYVGFCESDDYTEAGMYGELYAAACGNQYPDVVKSDFYFFFQNGKEEFSLCYSILPKKQENLYGKVLNLRNEPNLLFRDINIWNGIYKREYLEEKKLFSIKVRVRLSRMPVLFRRFI